MDSSLPRCAQTGSGAHPASYEIGTEGFSPWTKWPGREVIHSAPSNAEFKNSWSYIPTSLYVSVV
jgi:hypothetical protein